MCTSLNGRTFSIIHNMEMSLGEIDMLIRGQLM